MRRHRFYPFVAALCVVLGACERDSGSGLNTAPTLFFVTQPGAFMVLDGGTIDITYVATDPDSNATTDLFADRDGDLTTTDDQVIIALGRIDQGIPETVTWSTLGVGTGQPGTGTYQIIGRISDGFNTITVNAQVDVTVNKVNGVQPGNLLRLSGTSLDIRISFDLPLVNPTLNQTTMPVVVGSTPVPGSYRLENNNKDVVFDPFGQAFQAGVTVELTVFTSVGVTAQAQPGSILRQSNFTTTTPRVVVAGFVGGVPAVVVVENIDTAPVAVSTVNLEAGAFPSYMTADSSQRVYISDRRATLSDSSIIKFDAASNRVQTTFALNKTPMSPLKLTSAGIALSPDQSELYVANYEGADFDDPNSVPYFTVLDSANGMEITRLALRNGLTLATGRLGNIVIAVAGRPRIATRAFVANVDSAVIHVIDLVAMAEIDTDGDPVNGTTPIALTTGSPQGLALDSTQRTLFVNHSTSPDISVIDVPSFTQTTLIVTNDRNDSGPLLLLDPDSESDPPDLPQILYTPREYSMDEGLVVLDVGNLPNVPPEGVISTQNASPNGGTMFGMAIVAGTRFAVLGGLNNAGALFPAPVHRVDLLPIRGRNSTSD